jgi:hypothetical protein
LLFFPSVGYEAKSLSFGNKLHDLSIFEKKLSVDSNKNKLHD